MVDRKRCKRVSERHAIVCLFQELIHIGFVKNTPARAIRASLKLDRQERARKADEAIVMELIAGNIKEAWRILKAWHRETGGAAGDGQVAVPRT